MRGINNAQNILNRVYTKMSEDFNDEIKAKLLLKGVKSVEYYNNKINTIQKELSDEEINVEDHMYANTENGEINEVSSSDSICQTAESEVKFLKEWLLLHTDLIQQQNDEIIDKDRQIFNLQRENEMLKERIICIEKGLPFATTPALLIQEAEPKDLEVANSEDMTQGPCDEDTKENIKLLEAEYCDKDNSTEVNHQNNHMNTSDNEPLENRKSANVIPVNDNPICSATETDDLPTSYHQEEYSINTLVKDCKSESDANKCSSSLSDDNFTISSVSEFDPMKSLRMSIRRKRVCSISSALSNESAAADEKQYGTFKNKKRRITKDVQMFTSTEPYMTQSHEADLGMCIADPESTECTATNLEVPRWRQKIYGSCYSMEGTEDLDDEAYDKRHMKLEIDEIKRKKWDVQNICRQRKLEKLKQRQERVGSASKVEENEVLGTFWPKVEDVEYLEVCDELPVSAFGYTVPKITPGEFNLPWLINPRLLAKKPHKRKSAVRKKSSRR